MISAVVRDRTEEITAFIVVCRSLGVVFGWPLIILLCLLLRRKMSKMVRHVRNLDDRESPGAALNEAYAICQELHRSYEEGIGQVDWLSRLLLKKPFAELEDLCEDLALASDPEARELAAKVAAAIA